MGSDRDAIQAAYDALDAAQAKVAALSCDGLTHIELLALLERRERSRRCEGAVDLGLVARLVAEVSAHVLGGTSLADVLARRLQISIAEARRRIGDAGDVGPRHTITGVALQPELPTTAAAYARGEIGGEHIRIIREFFRKLPGCVDSDTREHAEETLGRIAGGLCPEELREAAVELSRRLDQDGRPPDDREHARKRFLTVGRQGADGMSEIRGRLDPEARAALDAVLARWAAPGMCNPQDDTPCVDDTPDPDRAQRDARSRNQRRHDALKAVLRAMLASGRLGRHHGLPSTIVATATLAELQSAAGVAVTGGGTWLPMRDLIRLASHAYHFLAVFDDHTQVPLYLGRTKRIASPGQRIVLHAVDRGCTFPGCTVPGYACQAHHAVLDWADGGCTDITDLTLACGPHNRLVEEGGWTTRKRKDGRTEWVPPAHLDTGQPRTNNFHHPQNYLLEPEDDDEPE